MLVEFDVDCAGVASSPLCEGGNGLPEFDLSSVLYCFVSPFVFCLFPVFGGVLVVVVVVVVVAVVTGGAATLDVS